MKVASFLAVFRNHKILRDRLYVRIDDDYVSFNKLGLHAVIPDPEGKGLPLSNVRCYIFAGVAGIFMRLVVDRRAAYLAGTSRSVGRGCSPTTTPHQICDYSPAP